MKICFNIHFHTLWGQAVYITGSIPELGGWDTAAARKMDYTGDGGWTLVLELPDKPLEVEYRYLLKSNGELIFEEWNRNHRLSLTHSRQSCYVQDYWQNPPQNPTAYSTAFTHSWFARPCSPVERIVRSKRKIVLKVFAPAVGQDERLALLGNREELGGWDPARALPMECEQFPEWWVELDADRIGGSIEYKFCVTGSGDSSVVRWEKGENRNFDLPPLGENETAIVSGLFFRDDERQWKCAGLSIPVFALRTQQSFGIGDFGDLHPLIDWAKATNQRLIQLLPVNDTTLTHSRTDSYPYNAISIYALHPLYLNLEAMGTLKDPQRAAFYQTKQKELNRLDVVDYEAVDRLKWAFFRELFRQEGSEVLASQEFVFFFEENKEWLVPYAAYSCLRDKYRTPDFRLWGEYAVYNRAVIEALSRSAEYDATALYYYLQFHADRQLAGAKRYACYHGIVLKGDIPIGISRESVEAWTEPDYFNREFQVGAPPDDFSLTGQNWGFPAYNWAAIEAHHYRWWKKRFRKMAAYFDAYRIDHILGFFRIWQIPNDSVEGLLGYFSPALPLSVEEIKNGGLSFRGAPFTRAHIHGKYLAELFGEYTDEVIQCYLERMDADRFALQKPFDTQRKIAARFAGEDNDKSRRIRSGLFALCNEVLFIEDHRQPGTYHPRISASASYRYRELDKQDQYAFDGLYWDYFYQRHNTFWKDEALKRLSPLIASTGMLACGEDLGMIPHSVPEVMQKLQILRLEIERASKSPNREFTDLQQVPYLSVCTTSTHDMPTLRGWWKEDPDRRQRYFNEQLKREGAAPEDCSPETGEEILRRHLASPAMLTVIPFQDWLAMDAALRHPDVDAERINVPANPRHYWRYRMHLCLEDLLKAETLNGRIRQLIAAAGRGF